jgi:hypothetical protein
MEFETVTTFNEPSEAEPLQKRLNEAGIVARIQDDRRLQRYAFVSKPYAGIRLQVLKEKYQDARKLLQEWDAAEGVLAAAVHCPACGSSRVEYPQFSRKSFIPNSIFGLFMAVGVISKEFYCQECHYTWPKVERIPEHRDILGWPERPHASTPPHARTP